MTIMKLEKNPTLSDRDTGVSSWELEIVFSRCGIEMSSINENSDSQGEDLEEEEEEEFSPFTCVVTSILVLISFWLPRNYEVLKQPELLIYTKLYNVIYTTIIPIFWIFSGKQFRN